MAALTEHNGKATIATYSGDGNPGDADGVETILQEAIKIPANNKITLRQPEGEMINAGCVNARLHFYRCSIAAFHCIFDTKP